jgi:hypothetical protein
MFGWFNKKKEETKVEETPIQQADPQKVKKPRKPKAKKEKAVPPPKAEPKVDILKFDFDPSNPKLGSIELDWNSEFVELLTKHGYFGNSEEEIVDKWLNDVCRTIITNQYPGMPISPAAIVNKKDIGKGKTEIS